MKKSASREAKQKSRPDDGTYRDPVEPCIELLYHPRSLTVLACIVGYLLYVALWRTPFLPFADNVYWGVLAAAVVFCLAGMLFLPDGPFIRPHPVMWRGVLALSLAYLMGLVVLLHLSRDDGRALMALLDPALGRPLPERSYAEDCSLRWSVVRMQLDVFVAAHAVGWFAKALILRDYWLCWVLSVAFELAEYSLQHQLPNFAECWWDHWVLDVLTCNALGIWLGMRAVGYFSMRKYAWRSIADIPGWAGRVRRTVAQFTPYSFVRFDWAHTRSLRGYVASLAVVAAFLACELNCFYLKYLLWVPSEHPLNGVRLTLHALMGAAGVRETFQFFADDRVRRLGAQAWLCVATIAAETLVCVKYGRGQFPAPTPRSVRVFWAGLAAFLVLYPLVRFVLLPRLSRRTGDDGIAAKTVIEESTNRTALVEKTAGRRRMTEKLAN